MQKLNPRKIKETACDKLAETWGFGALACIVYWVVSMIACIPQGSAPPNSRLQLLLTFIYLCLTPVLQFGFIACFYEIARSRKKLLKLLFVGFSNGFSYFFKVFLTTFLVGIFTTLWTCLLIIPGIIKWFSYAMTPFVLMDHPEYSPLQAICESQKWMAGHRMELFKLMLHFWPWILLGFFTLGIAYLWVAPYMITAIAEFYLQLKEIQKVSANAKSVNSEN